MDNTKAVLEWAPFTLVDDVDEAALLKASAALQKDFLSRQAGFISRQLLRGEEGQWVDVVVWETQQAADQAAKNAHKSPDCFNYFQLMDADHNDPGAGVLHFERVAAYGKSE